MNTSKAFLRQLIRQVLLACLYLCPAYAQFPARGAEAVDRLVERLERIHAKASNASKVGARLSAMTNNNEIERIMELAPELMRDESLYVDSEGYPLHMEDPLEGADWGEEGDGLGGDDGPDQSSGEISPDQAFRLHSNPGAKKTLLLWFTGWSIKNTAWNTYTGQSELAAEAFDMDGNPDSFNEVERTKIIDMWRRVKEDFSAFDVDVTTEAPESPELMDQMILKENYADETYGGIAIITKYMSGLCSSSNCGGVAYRDAIPSSSYYRHFAFVFANNLANNARYMGEAISHELGHNLGLSHDGKDSSSYYYGHGSGETAWAPIMGAGYFKNLVQWSKGEYLKASNTQDDITLISAILGGRDDDHGDARGDATLLNDEEVVLEGIVETSGDQDVFEFFAEPDPVVFSVAPALFGPSVDLQVTLLDEAGQVLAESNPPDLLAAQIDFEIPAKGAYYLVVQGAGKGDPLADGYSEYGSIGSYSIQGSFSRASFAPEAAIAVSQQQINQFRFSAADSNDVDGSILQYQWNFGDGNIVTGEEVEHSYSNPGKYVVQLEVIDEDQLSATATRTIEVNAAPVAIAITDILSGTGPLTVQFDASSSVDTDGIIVSYQWDFDGKSITGVFAQHTFKGLGTYPVSLTVTDDKGASTVSTLSIVVHESEQVPGNESDPGKGEDANRAPIVTFKADALTTTVPRIVSFNGAKSMDLDGQIVAFDWDFGDGQRGEGALIEHTFMAEGTYSVVLTVTDDKGAKGNATSTITIEDIKTCDAASIKAAKNKFRKSYQKSCRKRFQLKSAARVRTCSINWKKMYKRKYGSSDCGAS